MNHKRSYPSLKAWRDANQLTQREAARILGISQPSYCRLETGQYYPPRDLVKQIVEVANIPLELLFNL